MPKFPAVCLGLAGSLMLFSPSVSAGPKDAYSDGCLYVYKHKDGDKACLTKKGRVLNSDGVLIGYLNRDYSYYIKGFYYKGYGNEGRYATVRWEQVNNNNTLVAYGCTSDGGGNCVGGNTKYLYQYINLKP